MYYKRKKEWFSPPTPETTPYSVCWWYDLRSTAVLRIDNAESIRSFEPPNLKEAFERCHYLKVNGPTKHAFDFASHTKFPMPDCYTSSSSWSAMARHPENDWYYHRQLQPSLWWGTFLQLIGNKTAFSRLWRQSQYSLESPSLVTNTIIQENLVFPVNSTIVLLKHADTVPYIRRSRFQFLDFYVLLREFHYVFFMELLVVWTPVPTICQIIRFKSLSP